MNFLSKEKTINVILLWLLIVSVSPFVFEKMGLFPPKIFIYILIPIMAYRLLTQHIIVRDRFLVFILLVQALYFACFYFVHQSQGYLFTSMAFMVVLVAYLFMERFVDEKSMMRIIYLLMVMMAFGAMIAFFLAFTGKLQPTILFERAPGDEVYNFWFTFTNSAYQFGNKYVIRPAGLFIEPGELGFFIIHALLLNKLSFKNQKVEACLLFLGLFTISLAYYVSFLVYYLLLFDKVSTKKRLYSTMILTFAVAAFVVYIFSLKDAGNESMVYHYTIGRFSLRGDHVVTGFSGRLNIFTDYWELFLQAPFLGYGTEVALQKAPWSNATILGPLIADGVIGSVVFFLHILYLFWLSLKKALSHSGTLALKVSFILLLNYLQRPYVTSVFVYVIILMMIHCVSGDYGDLAGTELTFFRRRRLNHEGSISHD